MYFYSYGTIFGCKWNLRHNNNLICRWRAWNPNIQQAPTEESSLLNVRQGRMYQWQTQASCILEVTVFSFILLPSYPNPATNCC
jgi:hypothetical protein